MLNGKHMPFWLDEEKPLQFNNLIGEKKVDVAIVGGGIAGI